MSSCQNVSAPCAPVLLPALSPAPSTLSTGVASMSTSVSTIASGFVGLARGLVQTGVGAFEELNNRLEAYRHPQPSCAPAVLPCMQQPVSKAMKCQAPVQVPMPPMVQFSGVNYSVCEPCVQVPSDIINVGPCPSPCPSIKDIRC